MRVSLVSPMRKIESSGEAQRDPATGRQTARPCAGHRARRRRRVGGRQGGRERRDRRDPQRGGRHGRCGRRGPGVRHPAALGLREAVGDDAQRLELVAVAEVGGVHLDVLGLRGRLRHAALPRHDAVGARVDARGGHAQRRGALGEGLFGEHPFQVTAVHDAVHRPGPGGGGVAAERAAQGDHRAGVAGQGAGHLAGVDAARAPADQAHPALVAVVDLEQQVLEPVGERGAGPEVAALAPVVRLVAQPAQVAAQEHRRLGPGEEARQHDDRVAVAAAARPAGCGCASPSWRARAPSATRVAPATPSARAHRRRRAGRSGRASRLLVRAPRGRAALSRRCEWGKGQCDTWRRAAGGNTAAVVGS